MWVSIWHIKCVNSKSIKISAIHKGTVNLRVLFLAINQEIMKISL